MTKPLRRALWVLVPSLVVVAAHHLAVALFPTQWGGPNIGGGAILLLAYIGVAVGSVRGVTAWRRRAQGRP